MSLSFENERYENADIGDFGNIMGEYSEKVVIIRLKHCSHLSFFPEQV
jgi:hypothetical protein